MIDAFNAHPGGLHLIDVGELEQELSERIGRLTGTPAEKVRMAGGVQ